MALVPAKYKGEHAVKLRDSNGLDANGKKRDTAIVKPGDVVLLPAEEVLGKTYLIDPRAINEPLDLGVGIVCFKRHEKLSDEEKSAIGYERHEGRADFEPLVPIPVTVLPDEEPVADEKKKEGE